GSRRLKRAYRVRLLRHQRERLYELARNPAGRDQLAVELGELGLVGRLALPEEIGDFRESGPARQIVDVIAAIRQTAVLPVQIAQLGLGGDDPFETPNELSSLGHGWFLAMELSAVRDRSRRVDTVYPARRRAQGDDGVSIVVESLRPSIRS